MKFQPSEGSPHTQEDAIEAKAFVDLYNISSERFRQKNSLNVFPSTRDARFRFQVLLPSASTGFWRLCSIEDLEEAYGWFSTKGRKPFSATQYGLCIRCDEALGPEQGSQRAAGPGWQSLAAKAPRSKPDLPCNIPTRMVRPEEASLFGFIMCRGLISHRSYSLFGKYRGQKGLVMFLRFGW